MYNKGYQLGNVWFNLKTRIACQRRKMITISICMIVKNEEAILARCLDSVADLADEIIIVDTGSTDATKKIAGQYTTLIYDYAWKDDFADARNFAFSKASMEYIYTADADEILDEHNRRRFQQMKEVLTPDIEIVQMKYGNQLEFGSVYNFDEEYRPKLFRRLREFHWEDPVHEMIRLHPVVWDSEIVITHKPLSNHAGRDLAIFQKQTALSHRLSKRLLDMYARELFLSGSAQDFTEARAFFEGVMEDSDRNAEEIKEAACVAAKAARLQGDISRFYRNVCKAIVEESCSEICCELGVLYEEQGDYQEAMIWYYNAASGTQPILDIRSGSEIPLKALARCSRKLGLEEEALIYEEKLLERQLTS
jgi:glycosyltransferase involved in cell wall biosynthesis